MKILALDAVSEACSAALWIDGELRERYSVAPREHTRLILPMVDELLQEAGLKPADLDLIAFDRGPGSFTGIRVTLSVVQGLAFAGDLPVSPVSSLAALAHATCQSGAGDGRILSLIDARMGELYWGYYHCVRGIVELEGEEGVAPLPAIEVREDCRVVGSGVAAYAEQLRAAGFQTLIEDEALRYPRAAAIAALAARVPEEAGPVECAQPVYLRNKVTG